MYHAEAIQKNNDVLQRCTTINLYVIDFLRAKDVLDEAQESDLKAERSHLKQRILLFQWLKVVPSHRYESFLQVMKDAEQEHVANLLTGSAEDDHLPLSDARYARLVKIRYKMAEVTRIDNEVIAELRRSNAISMTDAEEIRAETVDYAKVSKLISAIMRRSNYSYNSFQEVLKKTLQTVAAEFLSEGEMPAVHLNNNRPDLDGPLSLAFNGVIRNRTTDDADIKELLADLNGLGLNPVRAIPGQSIVIFIYCKTVSSAVNFAQIFKSGRLHYILESIFNRLILTIEPRNTKTLDSSISLEDEEVISLEEFTGIEGWNIDSFKRRTPSSDIYMYDDDEYDDLYSAVTQHMPSQGSLSCDITKQTESEDFFIRVFSLLHSEKGSLYESWGRDKSTLAVTERPYSYTSIGNSRLEDEIKIKMLDRELNNERRYSAEILVEKRRLQTEIEQYKTRYQQARVQLEQICEGYKDQINQINNELESYKAKNRELEQQISLLTKDLEQHDKKIENMEEKHWKKRVEWEEEKKVLLQRQLEREQLFYQNRIEKIDYLQEPKLIGVIKSETRAAESYDDRIYGLAILDNEIFTVRRLANEFHVFGLKDYNFIRTCPVKGMRNPRNIVPCSNEKCLYILDWKFGGMPKEILAVDANGNLLKEEKWLIADVCGHMSVTPESNVILPLAKRMLLNEFTPHGQLLRQVHISVESGIINPWHAVKLSSGHFVVSHGDFGEEQHRVCIIDTEGNLIKAFGDRKGCTNSQMDVPSYLAVDGDENILVVDRNNRRVLLLSPDLKFKRALLHCKKHELRDPWRVCLDWKNGRMLVAENGYNSENSKFIDGRVLIFSVYKMS